MCFIHGTPWTQNVNQIYIRCSEEFLDVFETSDVRSIYVLCPGSKQNEWVSKALLVQNKKMKICDGWLKNVRTGH